MNLLSFLTPKDSTFYLPHRATIRQALEKYDYHKFTVIPLIDEEGHYFSSISEGDILRYIKNCAGFDIEVAEGTSLEHIERYRPYKALSITCTMEEVITLSLEQNFIPLVDDRGMYIGIIKRKDIINHLYQKYGIK